MNGSVLYTFNGNSAGDNFSASVSDAGDVNGDGTPDLIVGAPFDDNNGNISGSARVLSGSDGSTLYTFNGDSGNDRFGQSVTGAGVVNGDGIDDLIVSAAEARGINGGNYVRVLSGSDGNILYTFNGNTGVDFGFSVSGVGDVNADGRANIIVGSVLDNNSGSARVLSGIDGSILYEFNGDNTNDQFGLSVSGVGDGTDDFIIGAPNGGANGGGYARVFVSQVLGGCNVDGVVNFLDISPFISILSAGEFLGQADTNADGVVDFLDISPFVALLSL